MVPLVLDVRGIGHCPSKKNHQFPKPDGSLGIDAKIKERMKRLENALAFALISSWQTTVKETGTACSLPSWMRSRVPLDDCWQNIPEIHLTVSRGAEPYIAIEITPLTK